MADERFARTDASVTGQALKILGSKAEAVLVGAAGPSSAMVQVELVNCGYKGVIYHTHGRATPSFLKSGGKAIEGALVTAGALIVADELPAGAPSKAVSEEFLTAYKDASGRDASTFASENYGELQPRSWLGQ